MQVQNKQTWQDQYEETLEAAGDKCQRIKKVTKVNESNQCMEGGLQEELVEYGVSMPTPQLTQQAASIGLGTSHNAVADEDEDLS